jgi:hypothetical protein
MGDCGSQICRVTAVSHQPARHSEPERRILSKYNTCLIFDKILHLRSEWRDAFFCENDREDANAHTTDAE